LRLDFNTEDDWRMRAVLPTIKFLSCVADKIIILSHRGRPSSSPIRALARPNPPAGGEGENWRMGEFNKKFSLRKDALRLQKLLRRRVRFIPHFDFLKIKKLIIGAPAGSIFVLENLRFLKGEEENDKKFAKQLTSLGDYYVNDAFAVSHRENASVCAITEFLPSFVGLELEQEIMALSQIMKKPKRPLVIILGGVKLSDKLGIIQYFKNKTDWFLVGGAVANTLLMLKGVDVKRSVVVDRDPHEAKSFKKLLHSKKILIPADWRMKNEMILDIGSKTMEIFGQKIKNAKTIIWNGPVGLMEKKPFDKGTFAVAQAIAKNRRAFSLIGGGETVTFLKKHRLDKKFSFISTAGGAMLEFLAGKRLPGIAALQEGRASPIF